MHLVDIENPKVTTAGLLRIVADLEDDVRAIIDYVSILQCIAGTSEDERYALALSRVARNIEGHAKVIEEARRQIAELSDGDPAAA